MSQKMVDDLDGDLQFIKDFRSKPFLNDIKS